MTYIKTIPYAASEGKLKKIYDRVKGPDDSIDNVLSIHSLRPHTLTGHMTLYKAVLHNANNTLPKWYLELIGVLVSQLNSCDYCVQHHSIGLKRALNDFERYSAIIKAIKEDDLSDPQLFSDKELIGLDYANNLTVAHNRITETDIQDLRNSEFTDGEILEINQVACYFNYVNRMVVGLGVSLHGDKLGLSPNVSDDPENWNHN